MHWRATNVLLFLSGLGIFVLGLPSCMQQGSETVSHTEAALSNAARQEIEGFLASKKDVVEAMPGHPESQEVLQKLLAIYRYDLNLDENDALRLMVQHFRDSNLGLYALKQYLANTPGRDDNDSKGLDPRMEFCEQLCANYPDARISLMAFDRLLEAGDDKVVVCDRYIGAHPDSKLALFVLRRKGDVCLENGRDALAAACYLEAWDKDVQLGPKLYDALRGIWLAHGWWMCLKLMPQEMTQDALIAPIKARALAEMRLIAEGSDKQEEARALKAVWEAHGDVQQLKEISAAGSLPAYCRAKAGAVLANSLAEQGSMEEALQILQKVYDVLAGEKDAKPESIDLAAALALWDNPASGKPPQAGSSVTSVTNIESSETLKAIRENFLDLVQKWAGAVSVEEQACYAFLIAHRQLKEFQVAKAIETLKKASELEGLSGDVKETIGLERARIVAAEYGNKAEAGRICAELCASFAPDEPPVQLRYTTGKYFFEGGAYDDALEQFRMLLASASSQNVSAAAEFMIGLSLLQKGESDKAVQLFEAFITKYPESDLSGRALYILGTDRLGAMQYAEARECFQELVERYPHSEYTEKAKDYVSRLEKVEAKVGIK